MLKKYSIVDEEGTNYGILTYAPETKAWHIEINPVRSWEDSPLSLALYIKQSIYSLDEKQSLDWVRDRLVPPNRQNIHHLLEALNLPEYDEFALLHHTQGISPNDNLHLVEI